MYIKPVIYVAAVLAVMASLWMLVVQPRLDLAEMREQEYKNDIAELQAQIIRQNQQIDDYIEENKRRQKIASELHEFTQRINTSLNLALGNIRRIASESPDPNLLACLDLPVGDFHGRVRAASAPPAPARD